MIIKLTEFTERGEVFVNSDNILCFQKDEDGSTLILIKDETVVKVSEDSMEVMLRINNYLK